MAKKAPKGVMPLSHIKNSRDLKVAAQLIHESQLSFGRNKFVTKAPDKLIQNWVYRGFAKELGDFSMEFRELVKELFPFVNNQKKQLLLTTQEWIDIAKVAKERGISLLVPEGTSVASKPKAKKIEKSSHSQVVDLVTKNGNVLANYSPEEMDILRNYEGAGGQAKEGAKVLDQYFTPSYVCEIMWKLAKQYGFTGGKVLEPAVGTGRFLEFATEQDQVVAMEPDAITATICQLLYPKATVLKDMYFEQAFLEPDRFTTKYKNGKVESYPFEPSKQSWLGSFNLVIGNPPYGEYKNSYSSYFKTLGISQKEQFFMYKSLELLEKDGLLVFLIPSGFIRNGHSYQETKRKILELATLVDCYRLPNTDKTTFENTGVGGDIIVLKRK